MPIKKFPLFIPAGSDPSDTEDPLLLKTNVSNKALININGKKLIEYVLEEVDKSEGIERIFIVGLNADDFEYQVSKPVDFIPSKGSRMDTILKMMEYLEEAYNGELPNHLAVLSADIPLITAEVIDSDLQKMQNEFVNFDDIQLFYPLIPKDILLEKYPEANKRFRKFTEGEYATGDFMLFSPKVLRNEKTRDALEKMMNSRKTMARLLLKFDIFAPIKYLLGRLSVREGILPFIKESLEVTMELLISEHPEICLDLDYPEDFEKFEELLNQK